MGTFIGMSGAPKRRERRLGLQVEAKMTKVSLPSLEQRAVGCLLGGALGDALGAPVEFDTLDTILSKSGGDPLRRFLHHDHGDAAGVGLITDDTQLTLFIAEGLLRANSGRKASTAELLRSSHASMLDWLLTQDNPIEPKVRKGLLEQEWLHSLRAPGRTCLSALEQFDGTLGIPAANMSKGCGSVMRSAPFAFAAASADDAYEIAALSAALTHGHPDAQHSAGALAFVINHLIGGIDILAAVDLAIDKLQLAGSPSHAQLLKHARLLASTHPGDPHNIKQLGAGWDGDEALAIAVYAALSHPSDLHSGLALAVTHSGDSDSTGSICGNILGAYLGSTSLPWELLAQLEGRALIEDVAVDLAYLYAMISKGSPIPHRTWAMKYSSR